MPSQEGGRRHEGGQFLKCAPPQFPGSHRQASALVVVEAQPLTSELFAQHAILFLKIVDDILMVLVQPAGERNQ